MRYLGTTMSLGLVLLLTGCVNRGGLWPDTPRPAVAAEVPTKEALVSYLNDNAQRIQTIDCRRGMELDVKQGIRPSIGLKGRMVCQKDRNFRLQAEFGGKTEVDMGSNRDEFWYWIGRADPPYLMHCSYQALSQGVTLPFPFQPEWIMEALGLAQHDASRMEMHVSQATLELVERGVGAQGQPVRKVIIVSRARALPERPQVTAYVLQDANGKEICSARILEVYRDPSSGAVVPQRVALQWPSENTTLTLKLNGMIVNGNLDPNQALALFARPQMAGLQSYDLAAHSLDRPVGNVQRAGGTYYR
jgi:hypothetical protein